MSQRIYRRRKNPKMVYQEANLISKIFVIPLPNLLISFPNKKMIFTMLLHFNLVAQFILKTGILITDLSTHNFSYWFHLAKLRTQIQGLICDVKFVHPTPDLSPDSEPPATNIRRRNEQCCKRDLLSFFQRQRTKICKEHSHGLF